MSAPAKNDDARRQPGVISEKSIGEASSAEVDFTPEVKNRKQIDPKLIRIDGQTQARCAINEETVGEYAEAMSEGAVFPPVASFFDGTNHWLADGFHRLLAAKRAGLASILVDEFLGTRRDALWHGLAANNEHGLRETRADRRRKVEIMLRDDEWRQLSDRVIARQCGVTHRTVASIRQELEGSDQIAHVESRLDAIGRRQSSARRSQLWPTFKQSDDMTNDWCGEILHATSSKPVAAEPRPSESSRTGIDQIVANQLDMNAATGILHHGKVAGCAETPHAEDKEPPPHRAPFVAALAVPARAPTSEIDRLRAENAELRDQLSELAANLADAGREIESLQRIAGADDGAKAALDEVRRMRAHVAVLDTRINGLLAEKAEAVRAARGWKRRAESASKSAAG